MRVTSGQLIFTTKLFIAGMAAFLLAVRIGLPQPYWSLATCCVCMNPVSGAIRSKAVYRFTGTFFAGLASLFLASLFASVPLLLIMATGIFAAVGFGIAFLDRTPRSYGFQLFSITMMLIMAAGVDHPGVIFDTVMARTSEISLGILATTLVDGLIAPGSMGGLLEARLRHWLLSMEGWARDVLEGHVADMKGEHDRLKTLADITSLSQLTSTLRYDPTIDRDDLCHVLAIQQRLLRMIPLLSAIGARLAGLGTEERAALKPHLVTTMECLRTGAPPPLELATAVRGLPLEIRATGPWQSLVHQALADMLMELVTVWSEVRQIVSRIEDGVPLHPDLARQIMATRTFPLPPDADHAVRMAAGILVAYILLCGFWYLTGWTQGANAVLLGSVALAFFGGGDEPGRAIVQFGWFACLSLLLAAGLSYGLLPLVNDLPTFLLAMACFMLPLGAWAAVNPMATLMLALGLSSINLLDRYSPQDFGVFLESSIATLLGIFVAFFGAGLFRRWGAEHQLHRILRFEAREIAGLSRYATHGIRKAYMERSLDRIASLSAHLAATGNIDQGTRLLARLRAGANIADLRILTNGLPPAARLAIDAVLNRFRSEFDASQPSSSLLTLIDQALDALWTSGASLGDAEGRTMKSLAGLRIALFERAPAWEPAG